MRLSLAGTFSLAGTKIPRIGYGMGGLAHSATVQDDAGFSAGVNLLSSAYELGIRHFDTAQFYGNGVANRLLKKAFAGNRSEVFIASKVGAQPLNGMPPMTAAQKPEELRAAIEENLETLGTDYLDMVYMRRGDISFTIEQMKELDQQ